MSGKEGKMTKRNMCFLSSALVVCAFGITSAHAAPSVKMLGANTAKIGTNAAVVKSNTDSNVPTQRLGSIRSKTVNNAAPVTVNRLTSPSVATDSGSDARLSLGKYIHSTGISAGTIKPATGSLPSPEVSSSDFVSLSDHVRDLERSLEGYYTKDEIDDKVADIVVGDMDDVFAGKQDAIEDLENIRSGAAAGATAVQPAALGDYALSSAVPTKTSELTNDSGFLTEHQDISGKANKADVYTKEEVDAKVANVSDIDISGKQDAIADLEAIRSGAAAGATAVQPAALGDYALSSAVPTKTSELTNDSGFLTAHQDISGKADKADVYTKGEVDTKVASIVAGDMTEALSGKQDTITDLGDIRSGAAAGATAVQPAALTTTLNNYALTADVPTKTSELTNDSGFLTAHQDISGKANVADVYTKGEVDAKVANIDVSGKQDTITDLGDIRSGAAAGATAVQPAALTTTLNNYALTADVPTKTSELTNDSGFLTEHQDISGLIANPTLPMFSGDYLLKVNLNNNGNYTYSWAKASDYSGGGSGSGGSSGGSDDDCDPNWEVCD